MNNKFKWFLIAWLGALTIGVSLFVQQEPVRFGGTNQKIVSNKEGNVLEVLAGGKILVDANATLAVNGAFQPTVVSVNGTPVFWVTPIPTPTRALFTGSVTNYVSGALITTGTTVTATNCFTNRDTLTTTKTITATGFSIDIGHASLSWQCVQ